MRDATDITYQGGSNDAVKSIVRHLVRISKPSRGPVLDIDPHSYRHTRHLENKKYTVEHVSQVSEIEDPSRMYAAIICSYNFGNMNSEQQDELLEFVQNRTLPTGYFVLSMLVKNSKDGAKKEKNMLDQLEWSRVRTSQGNTISFNTGDTHPCLDVILQKPEI